MSSWLIPALKAVLPHVGDIISAAKPVFTKKRSEAASGATDLVQQQIAELQSAASQQSAYIKDVAALEKAAAIAEQRLRRAMILTALAAALAIVALGVALLAALTR